MPSQTGITLKKGSRNGETVVRIEFPYNREVINTLKEKTTATWSRSLNCWYIPESDFQLNHFFADLKPVAYIDYSTIKSNTTSEIKTVARPVIEKGPIPAGYIEKLEQMRYGNNSVKTYKHCIAQFTEYFKEREIDKLAKDEVNEYILHLIKTRNISPSYQNQMKCH